MAEPGRLILATMFGLTGCGHPPAAQTDTVAVVVTHAASAATPTVRQQPPITAAPASPRAFDPDAVLQDDASLRPLPPTPSPANLPIRAPTDAEWQAAQHDR